MTEEPRRIPSPSIDKEFYDDLVRCRDAFRLVREVEIPERSGRGFVVERGQTVRIVCKEGCQIADVDIFNADNPGERLWANQTLNREGAHLTTYSRLWSNMPWFRPLMTIIEDTVENVATNPGARHHIILGAHCNPFYWLVATGEEGHPNCYDNLVGAIAPFGLGPEHVHDNLNLFQKTRIDPETGRYVTEASDVGAGDFVEFYAEVNVLMAVSACPLGSGRYAAELRRADTKPLLARIYETGVEPVAFEYGSSGSRR